MVADQIEEVVADKGYHSNRTLCDLDESVILSFIAEPNRGKRNWEGKEIEQELTEANLDRTKSEHGRELMRKRGELLERPFAHVYETGGMRRVYLRRHDNILKRLVVHIAGANLGLLMRTIFGVGTPRSRQGRLAAFLLLVLATLMTVLARFWAEITSLAQASGWTTGRPKGDGAVRSAAAFGPREPSTTGC